MTGLALADQGAHVVTADGLGGMFIQKMNGTNRFQITYNGQLIAGLDPCVTNVNEIIFVSTDRRWLKYASAISSLGVAAAVGFLPIPQAPEGNGQPLLSHPTFPQFAMDSWRKNVYYTAFDGMTDRICWLPWGNPTPGGGGLLNNARRCTVSPDGTWFAFTGTYTEGGVARQQIGTVSLNSSGQLVDLGQFTFYNDALYPDAWAPTISRDGDKIGYAIGVLSGVVMTSPATYVRSDIAWSPVSYTPGAPRSGGATRNRLFVGETGAMVTSPSFWMGNPDDLWPVNGHPYADESGIIYDYVKPSGVQYASGTWAVDVPKTAGEGVYGAPLRSDGSYLNCSSASRTWFDYLGQGQGG